MTMPELSQSDLNDVLTFLDVTPTAPSLDLLTQLVDAWTRSVPWESASRIARRAAVAETADCPRWPQEFWQGAMTRGTGGTCFESNFAFAALLTPLGFDFYLTINDMGESIGCHTAVVVTLDGEKWLADVGLPIFVPLPLDETATRSAKSFVLDYRTIPQGPGVFEIERKPHPKQVAFTLRNRPVAPPTYRAAVTNDYGPDGLFLKQVIVNKRIGDAFWRFNADGQVTELEYFTYGVKHEVALETDVAAQVAAQFALDETTLRTALDVIHQTRDGNLPKPGTA